MTFAACTVWFVSVALSGTAWSEDASADSSSGESRASSDDPQRRERDRFYRHVARYAAAIEFFEQDQADAEPAQAVPQPILRFNDNVRDHDYGTVWVWGREGRPLAIAEIFSHTQPDTIIHGGHSLTSGALIGREGERIIVNARRPGLALQKIPSAPEPASDEAGRVRQIKSLARRFSAHEFWRPGRTRYDLRLLVQPLHHYRDPGEGLQEGAIFTFCHGTNPEVILLIELRDPAVAEWQWQFACVRMSAGECHVLFDGEDLWQCAESGPTHPPGDANWAFLRRNLSIDFGDRER